jgi:hypothetical protein
MMEEEEEEEEKTPTKVAEEIPLKIISSKMKNGFILHEEEETPVPIAIQKDFSSSKEKFAVDSNADSGVISDIDLRLVSA